MEEKIRKKIRAEGAWGWVGNARNAGVKVALYSTIILKACNFYTLKGGKMHYRVTFSVIAFIHLSAVQRFLP